MATKAAVTTKLDHGLKVVWSDLDTGDDGAWVECADYPDKTLHISGTATAVVVQGSNEAAGANPFTLTGVTQGTPGGGPINAAGGWAVVENPLMIRPLATTATNVVVTMICKGRAAK